MDPMIPGCLAAIAAIAVSVAMVLRRRRARTEQK